MLKVLVDITLYNQIINIIFMKDFFKMVKNKIMEEPYIRMVIIMIDLIKIVIWKEEEYLFSKMVDILKENLRITNLMEKEFYSALIEIF